MKFIISMHKLNKIDEDAVYSKIITEYSLENIIDDVKSILEADEILINDNAIPKSVRHIIDQYIIVATLNKKIITSYKSNTYIGTYEIKSFENDDIEAIHNKLDTIIYLLEKKAQYVPWYRYPDITYSNYYVETNKKE